MQQWLKDLENTLSSAERQIAPQSDGMPAGLSKAIAQYVKPKDKIFEREEIRQRMANFKATQRRFEIERDEFFNETMARLRGNSF